MTLLESFHGKHDRASTCLALAAPFVKEKMSGVCLLAEASSIVLIDLFCFAVLFFLSGLR